jgi:hypothetical protein
LQVIEEQRPDQNVALANLAMLADVDTRTIKETRSYIALSTPLHKDVTFLNELIPEVSVLDLWDSGSKYKDQKQEKQRYSK